jgi:hypothetical protein
MLVEVLKALTWLLMLVLLRQLGSWLQSLCLRLRLARLPWHVVLLRVQRFVHALGFRHVERLLLPETVPVRMNQLMVLRVTQEQAYLDQMSLLRLGVRLLLRLWL